MLLVYSLIFITGTICGSFAVCYGWRFANSYSIIYSRSFCEKCHTQLKKIYLIPIIGFLIQGGRCTTCHSSISIVSLIVEFFFGSYFLLLSFLTTNAANFIFVTLLSLWALLLALQDFYSLTVSSYLLCFGSFFFLLQNLFKIQNHFVDWPFILLFLISLAIFTSFKFLGLGDVIYLGFLFFILGFYDTLYIIMIGSSCAGIYHLFAQEKKIAFIPFLSFGLFLLLIYQESSLY